MNLPPNGLVGGDLDVPRALLIALAVAVLVAFGTLAATSSAAFGLYNPTWDGGTEFRGSVQSDPGVETHLVRDTERYETLPSDETVAFVTAPEEPYDGADADRIREFVASGGTLVVLENFGGHGNELLADVGAGARVDGRLLVDEQHHYRGPKMPIATTVENHTLTTGVDRLTLNYATAVEPRNATVLVSTSEFASLGSEAAPLDERDELRSYPVATTEPVGDGRVVVVGDPSITVNAMLERPDNAAFVRGLYADADHVVFDRSHAAGFPPLTAAVLFLRDSPLAQLVVGTVGIGVIALSSRVRIGSLPRRIRDPPPSGPRAAVGRGDGFRKETRTGGLSDAERAAILRRRHPDWDPDRIRRIIIALNNTSLEPDGTHERDR